MPIGVKRYNRLERRIYYGFILQYCTEEGEGAYVHCVRTKNRAGGMCRAEWEAAEGLCVCFM